MAATSPSPPPTSNEAEKSPRVRGELGDMFRLNAGKTTQIAVYGLLDRDSFTRADAEQALARALGRAPLSLVEQALLELRIFGFAVEREGRFTWAIPSCARPSSPPSRSWPRSAWSRSWRRPAATRESRAEAAMFRLRVSTRGEARKKRRWAVALAALVVGAVGTYGALRAPLLLCQRACDGGRLGECVTLGDRYREGHGVARSLERAADAYRRACDGGEMRGCANLGSMYEHGTGVKWDARRAVELYTEGLRRAHGLLAPRMDAPARDRCGPGRRSAGSSCSGRPARVAS